MNNFKIDLAVDPIALAKLNRVISHPTSEEGVRMVAVAFVQGRFYKELARIATLGLFSEPQMLELIGAICSTPTGISYTQALDGIRNRTSEGWDLAAILDWLQGNESDRLPPRLQAAFGK